MKKSLLIIVLTIFCLSNTFSQTYNEAEPNDSFEQANLVTAPVTIIAASGNDDDVDFFKVDLASAAVITFTLTDIQSNQFFRLYAYNSDENQFGFVQSAEDGAGFTYDFLLPAGISFIKIFEYGNNPSSNTFRLELSIDTSDGCEVNNSFETACLVSPDAILHPQLFGYNSDLGGADSDFYKLDLPVGGVVTVNLSNLAVDQFIKLAAYNSFEDQIAFVQSPEDGAGFSIDLLLPPGISYIKLFDYSSIKSDSIHLDLELTFDDSDVCEPNNSFETACMVEADTVIHPQLFGYNSDLGGNDADYYKVEAGIILNQCFTISNVQPDQYIRLYIYDEDYNQIGFEQSPNDGSGFFYCLDLGLDLFYFKLVNYGSASNSEHLTVILAGIGGLSVPTIGQIENLISVFPNPTSGSFTLTFPETSTQIQILNSLGQVIESKQVYQQEQFEFEMEKKGMYFIMIKTNLGTIIRKLVVTDLK